MNPIELDLIAYAAGRELGQTAKQWHKEVLEALKTKSASGPLSEIKMHYTLLALNGYDLRAICSHCKGEIRFPPEYGGEMTQCIHCKTPLRLIVTEETRWIPCEGGFTTHLPGGKIVQALNTNSPSVDHKNRGVFHDGQSCKFSLFDSSRFIMGRDRAFRRRTGCESGSSESCGSPARWI